ncbi:MAG: glycosyltransferase family A protein [Limisphaerales bacterium]
MHCLTSVIPVYNGERFLQAALGSLAQQTRRPDRVVVLDNCSTDGTRNITERFRELKCEWQRNESNLGLIANLNRALGFANQTEYLHILPVDDLLKPNFFGRLLSLLEPVHGRSIGYTPYELVNERGTPLTTERRKKSEAARSIPLRTFLAAQAELQTVCCPAVVLKTCGQPVPCEFRPDLPLVADVLFYAEFSLHCERIVEWPEVLSQCRQHQFSATSRNALNLRAWVLDEWKVMKTITPFMGETGFRRWLRQQRLKCLFAARSQVKVQMMEDQHPDYAREIRHATTGVVGPIPWALGKLAVEVRDLYQHVRGKRQDRTWRSRT